jgi:hypothetical protein
MMTSDIFPPICANNLSTSWALAFLHAMARGVNEITPLVVTVADIAVDSIPERQEIREALDQQILALKSKHPKLQSCHTVANTIFPHSMWNPNGEDDAARLFARFEKAWPRIKRCSQNRRGSYFRRLTAFRPVGESKPVNQLEHIVNTYRGGNHRRSALQAAIFDPALDHKNSQQLGFPCLHQIAFTPIGDAGLAVTGFYATQYLFDRAYGNYLGLCRLGRFMARQMDLRLVRMTCIASVAQLGTPTKSEVQPLGDQLTTLLDNGERKSS